MKTCLPLLALLVASALVDDAAVPRRTASACCSAEETFSDASEVASPAAARPGASETRDVMRTLGEAFRDLDKALAAGDSAGARGALDRLQAGAADLPSISGAPQWLRDRSFARIRGFGRDVGDHLEAGALPGARSAFEDVRKSCVACHARIDGTPAFPASGATVSGHIKVRTANDAARQSHGDVFVHLAGARAASRPTPPRRNPVISQRGRSFQPRLLPIVRNTTVDFPNDDTIFHNVFSLSPVAKFDLGIYDPGKKVSVTFEKVGIVPIFCNIHPEMRCTIIVVDDPHFAMTENDGSFVITGVPEGTYEIHTWNEFGARSADAIELRDGKPAVFTRDIRETKTTLEHRNKHGRRYGDDYK